MRKSIALLAACAATASAFAPTGYVGLSRQTNSGVTSLSMNAGTGKIKVVSAARAGVPRATLSAADTKKLANYDSAAALGIKNVSPITYAKPGSSFGAKSGPVARKVGLGTQPVTPSRAVAKPMSTQRVVAKPMSTQRVVAKPAPRPVVRAVPKPVARAAPRPVARAAPKPAPVRAANRAPVIPRAAPRPAGRAAASRPAPKARPTPTSRAPAFKAPSMPSFKAPSVPSFKAPVMSVAPPSTNSNGIDLLERVETLRLLTALYNAGALQKIERAGLLSSLEKAGALSSLEKLLPQLEALKPISLARNVLSIPAGTFYIGAAAVSIGDLALLFESPKLGVAATLAAIPLAIALVIGGQVNGVVQGTTPVNLQSILGPRLRD